MFVRRGPAEAWCEQVTAALVILLRLPRWAAVTLHQGATFPL